MSASLPWLTLWGPVLIFYFPHSLCICCVEPAVCRLKVSLATTQESVEPLALVDHGGLAIA